MVFVCQATDEAKKQRDTEELGDAMKALENRTLDSKQEMDILAALDEMKSMRVSSFPFQLRHILASKLSHYDILSSENGNLVRVASSTNATLNWVIGCSLGMQQWQWKI